MIRVRAEREIEEGAFLPGQAGWDCVSIDQQHGLGGNEAMVQCLTSAKASNMPALVRVAENDLGLVRQGARCRRARGHLPADNDG